MALFCLVRRRHAEEARVAAGSSPPFEPEYADDSFSGGRVQDDFRCFREDIKFAEKYGLSYDLSQRTLYVLAGMSFVEMFRVSKLSAFGFKPVLIFRC